MLYLRIIYKTIHLHQWALVPKREDSHVRLLKITIQSLDEKKAILCSKLKLRGKKTQIRCVTFL